MYSLIIVDDDELIRKGLEKVIPWGALGLSVISAFSSATEALEYLRTSPVDVILTDVKMPGMSGLDLVKEARKIYPRCKAVIISGFSEFELVKNALTLKVEDYLLKPLSQDCIEQVFRKVVSEIDSERLITKDPETSFHSDYSLLTKLSTKYSLWAEYIEEDSAEKVMNKFALVMCDGLGQFESDIEEVLAGIPHVSNGKYAVFISTADDFSHRLESVVTVFRNSDERNFKIVVGSDVFWEDDIIFSFWGALGMIPETEYGMVSYYRDKRGNELPELVQYMRKTLIARIESGCQEEIDKALCEAIDKTSKLKPDEQGYVYCSVIYKLLVYFSMKDSIGKYQYGSISFSNATPRELAERFRHDFLMLTKILSSRSDSNARLLILRTKEYVKDHYSNPSLRLQDIADNLQISYGYLSSIFTRISGQSFKQFLINVRMEEARNLLLSRKYRIYEIADKVGYSNTRYFNEAFHKYYGCSPVEYLNKLRM